MTLPADDEPVSPAADELGTPPETGVPQIDEQLARLTGLEFAELSEHHGRLTQAHAALQDVLEADPSSFDEAAQIDPTPQRDRRTHDDRDHPARP